MQRSSILAVIIAVAVVGFLIITSILADLYWFSAVGFESVFLTILLARIALFIAGFAVFFGFSYGNAILAARKAAGIRKEGDPRLAFSALFAGFVSLSAALSLSASWETVLRYLNRTPFGTTDPLFGLDAGLYIFDLPFYLLVVNFLLALCIFAVILSAVAFFSQILAVAVRGEGRPQVVIEGYEERIDWRFYLRSFLPQLSFLLFLVFAVLGVRLWLARFDLLFSATGAVYGAGYTDVHVTLPVLTILAIVTFIIGIGFLVNEKFRRVEVITYGVAAFAGIALIGIIAAVAVQALIVQPDELTLEEEYLDRNIRFTLAAYGLDDVAERAFPVNYTLSAEDIRENNATVENIRLWDWRPLKTTYEQLQLFRTYYSFNDVDVDRYRFDGQYKQVLVSAREMDVGSLQPQAQTWVNTRLVYTHGYGAVMNPVDRATAEGLPVFYLKDIPPSSDYLLLDQPRIYYGELAGTYAVTHTTTDEFDYPSGDRNIYRSYDGAGGVPLSDGLRRLVYAMRFRSVELLISGALTPESRLLFRRTVGDRAATIAPFLHYDPDPYVVIEGGRMYWIIDAYTAADRYPYAEPVRSGYLGGMRFNYLRNSVKVVVDAYDGDVHFYVVDPDDPLVETYQAMFPCVFEDFSAMPAELQPHIRYPQALFEVQATVYATYHMTDPRVFYNREDAWVVPDEVYRGSRQPMEPYYVIMKLPGEEAEEFILMLPFTPRGKENMIGWMAARCDMPHYGRLLVYQFSKQELTYGPMQVEARIDQDTEISQRITLWSQSGSSVLRGNTLVIPIEDSIVYVEPLYLEARERGTLPQLQRVIVAYNDRLTMQPTLAEAFAVIFGEGAAPVPPGEAPPPVSVEDAQKLARIADLYGQARQALADGDLGRYQELIDEIGAIASG
ncbi:MAG TPA: UPF0182 family protein [Methanoculleus sp.]|nr:UPF0182 family protein [Methanoculleus sp.]